MREAMEEADDDDLRDNDCNGCDEIHQHTHILTLHTFVEQSHNNDTPHSCFTMSIRPLANGYRIPVAYFRNQSFGLDDYRMLHVV